MLTRTFRSTHWLRQVLGSRDRFGPTEWFGSPVAVRERQLLAAPGQLAVGIPNLSPLPVLRASVPSDPPTAQGKRFGVGHRRSSWLTLAQDFHWNHTEVPLKVLSFIALSRRLTLARQHPGHSRRLVKTVLVGDLVSHLLHRLILDHIACMPAHELRAGA